MSEDNPRPQFDSSLGGPEVLPECLKMRTYVAARGQEIQIMKTALNQQNSTKMAFQTIPIHMRRRAMSHNSKRLPRRLRQIHMRQMKKSGMPVVTKRPCRRFRRRPNNLLKEYTKRANKKNRWLQTHIWHAKRFRMIEKWGYKLADHPCDKSYRACYRAAARHCLLEDISYISCVEIRGNRDFLLEHLKQYHRQGTGLSLAAKAFENGCREGETVFFKAEGKAIGSVRFHWKPSKNHEISTLWLWIHAAFYEELLNLIITTFELTQLDDRYLNTTNDVILRELNDELCRFRMWGPLSNAILHNAFIPYEENPGKYPRNWVDDYTENFDNSHAISAQNEFWKSLRCVENLGQISPHVALSLIVKDPRTNFPKKRTKCQPESGQFPHHDKPFRNVAHGPIWDKGFRLISCRTKMSNGVITEMRSKLLVPGSDLDDDYRVYIPLLLIQRPGNRLTNLGFGSGWDLVMPTAWASTFWLSIIMHSARAGGLRESNSTRFEMGITGFLFPDTNAGRTEELLNTKENVSKFFRLPPAKRTNFNKFNISSPFECNWSLLLKEWGSSSELVEDFSILRDRIHLREVQDFLSSKTRSSPDCACQDVLIPVRVECGRKGAPNRYSIICLPHSNDPKNGPIEPQTRDKFEQARKDMRRSHKMLLKKLRKRRIIDKKRNTKTQLTSTNQETLNEYSRKMRALWLPPAKTIQKSCSRDVIGFVTKGGFMFTVGSSCGVGYIASNALTALVHSKKRDRVLVRNTNSRQYRWAKMSVIFD